MVEYHGNVIYLFFNIFSENKNKLMRYSENKNKEVEDSKFCQGKRRYKMTLWNSGVEKYGRFTLAKDLNSSQFDCVFVSSTG